MIKILYNIIIHVILVASVLFGISQCNSAKKVKQNLTEKEEIFNKANEIVDIILDSDSNKITKSKPNELLLSEGAMSTAKLIDSVSEELKLPKNERIRSITKIPIKSEISLKAKEVNEEFAYTENENWYSRYSFKDSVFDLGYKAEYNSIETSAGNSFLGISYGQKKEYKYDLLKDKNSYTLKPTTIRFIEKEVKKRNSMDLNNVNKYRNFDNGVLTGLELELELNRLRFGGQYLYNLNTDRDEKKEWEVSVKYNLF